MDPDRSWGLSYCFNVDVEIMTGMMWMGRVELSCFFVRVGIGVTPLKGR